MGSLGHLEPQTSKGKRLDGGKKEEVSTTKSPYPRKLGSMVSKWVMTYIPRVHPTWISQEVSKWLVHELYSLLINGVYWGYNPLILALY